MSLWDHSEVSVGISLGSLWHRFEITLRSLWDHFGTYDSGRILGGYPPAACSARFSEPNARKRVLSIYYFWSVAILAQGIFICGPIR